MTFSALKISSLKVILAVILALALVLFCTSCQKNAPADSPSETEQTVAEGGSQSAETTTPAVTEPSEIELPRI